jgi:hypothetical protein
LHIFTARRAPFSGSSALNNEHPVIVASLTTSSVDLQASLPTMVSLTEASNDRPPFGARPSVRTALDFSSTLASHGTARSANQAAACAAFQIALSSQTAAAEPMQSAAFTGTCIINIQPKGGSERANTDALAAMLILHPHNA